MWPFCQPQCGVHAAGSRDCASFPRSALQTSRAAERPSMPPNSHVRSGALSTSKLLKPAYRSVRHRAEGHTFLVQFFSEVVWTNLPRNTWARRPLLWLCSCREQL